MCYLCSYYLNCWSAQLKMSKVFRYVFAKINKSYCRCMRDVFEFVGACRKFFFNFIGEMHKYTI